MRPASEKRTRAWAKTRFSIFQVANSGYITRAPARRKFRHENFAARLCTKIHELHQNQSFRVDSSDSRHSREMRSLRREAETFPARPAPKHGTSFHSTTLSIHLLSWQLSLAVLTQSVSARNHVSRRDAETQRFEGLKRLEQLNRTRSPFRASRHLRVVATYSQLVPPTSAPRRLRVKPAHTVRSGRNRSDLFRPQVFAPRGATTNRC